MFAFQAPPVESTPQSRRHAENRAICFTCVTEMGRVPFNDAAILILYASLLGAGDGIGMFTTGMHVMVLGLLSIPAAWLALRDATRQGTIIKASAVTLVLCALIVCAPLFGAYAKIVLLGALVLGAFMYTVYLAAWFPLLDTFLPPERRGVFLGKMDFSWQLATAAFLFVTGALIGKNPPLCHLQYAMVAGMAIYALRMYFCATIPRFDTPAEIRTAIPLREGFKQALANKALTGNAVYFFILNIAAFGTIPLATIYLKKALGAPDNIIILISATVQCGMLTGSLCAGRIIRRFGIRATLLGGHAVYALANLTLFLTGRNALPGTWLYGAVALTLFAYSFACACVKISSQSEMMHLADPGNKITAMAFNSTFYYTGCGMARILTSLLLGSGVFAASWSIGSMVFCHYQTLFLFYAVGIVFAASLLVVVPAVFPKGNYHYDVSE